MQFDFGQNWSEFSSNVLLEEKINQARKDFHQLVETDLTGKSFVDIGFGQGLSLLIAAESGANTVGCDISPKCDETLTRNRSRFFSHLSEKQIPVVIGSILETDTVEKIKRTAPDHSGMYDIVHSWGVLHHTGDMDLAISNAAGLVKSGGLFIVAIYNRHWSSAAWKMIKWFYCSSPRMIQKMMIALFYPGYYAAQFIVTGKNPKKQKEEWILLQHHWMGRRLIL